jgi:hypothetical protein
MHNANTVVDQFLGGWDFGGITSWRTGFPFTIFANTGTDFSGFNQFADRANVSGPVAFNYDDPNNAFSKAQFTSPGAGSIGNTGRNSFYGPHYTDFDLSLHKNFPVSEGKKFQLRADVFNVFNHPNFNLPVSNLGSGSAGKITRMYGNSRLMQLGLRFDF